MKSAASIAALLSLCLFVCLTQAKAETAQTQFSSAFELLKAGKPKEAAAKFEAGLKADPKNALAHYYLGEAYAALKSSADAKKQYQASLDSDPASSVAANAKEKLAQLSVARAPAPSAESTVPAKSNLSAEDTVAFINSRLQCEVAWTASDTDDLKNGNCRGATSCKVDESHWYKYSVSVENGNVLIYKSRVLRFERKKETDDEVEHINLHNKIAMIGKYEDDSALTDLTPEIAVAKLKNTSGAETQIYSVELKCRDEQACASSKYSAKLVDMDDDTFFFKKAPPDTQLRRNVPTEEQKSAYAALITVAFDPVAISKALEGEEVKNNKKKSGFYLLTCDQDSAERLGRAFTHLIEISGGKKSKPLPF